MGLITMIILGLVAGWLASSVMQSSTGLFTDIILGIIGAITGGFLMSFLGQPGLTGFNLYSILVAVCGSLVLIWIGRFLTKGEKTLYS